MLHRTHRTVVGVVEGWNVGISAVKGQLANLAFGLSVAGAEEATYLRREDVSVPRNGAQACPNTGFRQATTVVGRCIEVPNALGEAFFDRRDCSFLIELTKHVAKR